jgi:hypothetical protein
MSGSSAEASRRRLGVLLGALVVVIVVGLLVRSATLPHGRPAPNAPGYNSGVMLNKAGTAYVTEDGRIVPTPPGEREPPNKGKRGGPMGMGG